MSKEKFDTALAAMTEVVRSVIDGEEPGRFAKAAALCTLTQKIALHAVAPRVGDVKKLKLDNVYGNPGYDAPEYLDDNGQGYIAGDGENAIQFGVPLNVMPHGNGNDFQRQVLMAIMPMLEGQKRQQDGSELTSLIEARDRLKQEVSPPHEQITALSERINQLIDAVALRASKGKQQHADQPDVVPAEPVRGHSSRVDLEDNDQGDGVRIVSTGEGGGDSAAAGSGEAAGGRTVLEPQSVTPFRSRLDQGADAGAAGTDLEGPKDPDQGAEAGTGSGERGEVRAGQNAGDDGAPTQLRTYAGIVCGRATYLRNEDDVRVYEDGTPV